MHTMETKIETNEKKPVEKSPVQSSNNFFQYAKYSFYLLICVAIGRFIVYSLEQYQAQDGENIFICDEVDCFQTTHIHADIEFDLCWETTSLPKETWDLGWLHTHKEKNYLHFHDKIAIDREIFEKTGEKKWLFEKALSLQEIFETYELDPIKYCWTEEIDIVVTVNDQPVELSYNRVDGDKVKITYTKK